jgi:type II secretory pathway pseudopilin PulG
MLNKKFHPTKSGNHSEAGFSLIEGVIVCLTIATILAFALPNINNAIKAYRLRNAADHLAERASAVRALAMAKNKNVTFSFNNSTGQYGFDFDADGAPDTIDPDEQAAGVPLTSYFYESLPEGVTATFPGNAPIKVTFNSRGELPIGASEQLITLQNSGKTVKVRVNLRGKISVE